MVPMERRHPFEILTETGFISSGRGPADLSLRYKEELRERGVSSPGRKASRAAKEGSPSAEEASLAEKEVS